MFRLSPLDCKQFLWSGQHFMTIQLSTDDLHLYICTLFITTTVYFESFMKQGCVCDLGISIQGRSFFFLNLTSMIKRQWLSEASSVVDA